MTTPVHISHRHLGRCGLKVSALTLGAMTFGESESFMRGVTSSDEEARNVLDAAIDAGIDTIDTANVYSEGRSEQLLGQWLEGRRHNVTLLTKCRFPIGFGNRLQIIGLVKIADAVGTYRGRSHRRIDATAQHAA